MQEQKKLKILGITGSLRKKSHNAGLLRYAAKLVEASFGDAAEFTIAQIDDIPLFNSDLEGPQETDYPASVQRLRKQVREADALLFAVPEYNYSMSGVLKNLIDWVSRPVGGVPQPFNDKPTAIFGAGGGAGTARAQYHFRQSAVFLNLHVINKPEVFVRIWDGPAKFDDNADLIDEAIQNQVKGLIAELISFTKRFN